MRGWEGSGEVEGVGEGMGFEVVFREGWGGGGKEAFSMRAQVR